jgi:long-chain fatty acid transport protein
MKSFDHSRRTARTVAAAFAPALLLTPLAAVAGGLLSYEVGTADVGLASAGYSARAQDASTVFTNPAGMTRLKGTQVLLGAQALYGDFEFSPNSQTSPALGGKDGGNPVGWFPGGGFFLSHNVTPDVTLGFAATGNFGLSLDFDKNWVGRYYGQEATLLGASFLPSIAYKATDKLSLGASLNATYGILKERIAINRTLPAGSPDGKLELDDRVWGYGFNLGMLYEFNAGSRIGLTYNSEVKLDFKPTAKFSGQGPLLQGLLSSRGLLDATVGLAMYIPQGVNASAFHQINDRWALLGSLGWQDWSRFGKIDVSIDNSNNPQSATTNLDFKDTWHAALGAQYRLSDPWLVNFGMAYDSKFQDSSKVSPMLPANDAWRFGVGVQNQAAKDFEWGVAAEYVYGGTVDIDKRGASPTLGGRGNLVGSYQPRMVYLSANASWKF